MCKVYIVILLCSAITITIINAQYFEDIEIHIYEDDKPIKIINADNLFSHRNLSEVTIENQRLHQLKQGTFRNFTQLKRIKIQYTELTTIQEGTFLSLPKLQIINLNFNKLKKIQEGVFNNLQMTKLYLVGNEIEEIEKRAFDFIPFLELLDLQSNKIKMLHPGMFEGTPYLKEINLSFNQIDQIPDKFLLEAFLYRPHVDNAKVDFSNNKINEIKNLTFAGIIKLDELLLNNNNISSIEKYAFTGMQIDSLNLEGNALRTLDDKILKDLSNCIELNIFANPWNCHFVQRYMRWVKKYKKEDTIDLHLLRDCYPTID